MARLTEEMVIARTRASDLSNIRKLNCWGSELSDVSLLRRMHNVEVLSLSYFLEHHLQPVVLCKRQNLLNSHPIVLHDGVRFPRAAPVVNLLPRWNWEVLEHAPYSPVTSPRDVDFFPKMQLPLRGVRFRTTQAIIAATEQSVRRSVQQDAVDGVRHLPEVWRRIHHVGGDYFCALQQCD
ncbi:hypothetical protein ANN_07975 [Periplaneta americana]|uniref:Uncharacterized protein n=1 Tax=Periplaneta americana TaxID=6978 RepID=A0ABQ8T1Q4_PERAM|nr:hypothetical protein ANN_07975 [Periplaneta americana]